MGSLDAYYERYYNGPAFKSGEEMLFEVLRLASFEKWPVWAVKRPGNLSDNGFYYCGHGDTVKCFACDGVLSNWSVGDDVAAEHRKHYPNCPFVLGRADNLKFGVGDVSVDKPKGAGVRVGQDSFGSGVAQLNSLEDIDAGVGGQDQGGASRSTISLPVAGNFKEASDDILQQLQSLPSIGSPARDRSDSVSSRIPADLPSTSSLPLAEIDIHLVKYENYRLRTFEGRWPEGSFVSPVDLAKAGFYYRGSGDNVQCAFCKGRLLNWKPTDNPMYEHQKHYPSCLFLQPDSDVGNVTAESESSKVQMPLNQETKKNPSPSERLGIMMDKPKHPEYAIESSRVQTFKAWPKKSIITSHELAKAGFFYVGYSDNVKCFFCDGGLRNWDRNDDPWTEHTRWFSKCGFLKLNKSEEYIKEILNRPNNSGNIETHTSVTPQRPGEDDTFDPRILRARMDTAMIQHVRTMGFSNSIIKKVLEDRLRFAGDDFPNLETLLQALFNQTEEQDEKRQAEAGAQAEAGSAAKPMEIIKPNLSRRRRRNRNKKKKKGLPTGAVEETRESVTPPTDQEEEEEDEGEDELNELNDPLLDPNQTTDEELRSLANQYSRIREERTCKICMDAECSIVFLPCGHLVCCSSCAPALRTCPICRTFIKGSVRIFTT